MLLCLLVGLMAILWALERRSNSAISLIHLDDLLLGEDGKASKAAAVMGGSFLVTSWVVVWQTVNGTLSDLTFASYIAAWVVPTVTKILKGTSPVSSSETVISSKTTEVKP